MVTTQQPLVESAIEQDVLVLKILAQEIHGDAFAEDLCRALCAALDGTDATNVVVNFENVTFITCAGLRAVIDFRRHVRTRGGRVLLCNLDEDVTEVFLSTHLAATSESSLIPFAIAPHLPEALAHFRTGGS